MVEYPFSELGGFCFVLYNIEFAEAFLYIAICTIPIITQNC